MDKITQKKVLKVSVIGGGTGTFNVLSGLKNYQLHLSALISMADSGGSNRILRDEFGLLPTSDIRQSIVALASPNSNGILRKLFTYRFTQGTGIAGHTFGNLFMAALSDIYGSQEKALKATTSLLQVMGDIIPITLDKTHLMAEYENGHQVLGEHEIDEPEAKIGRNKITNISLVPKAKANKKALVAIKDADYIIIGPGDLYTSIVSNLVVDGIAKAIRASKAKKIYIMNLMTKFGQTNDFTAKDHLIALEKYLGKGTIDIVLVNKNTKLSEKLLTKYKSENSQIVVDDLGTTKHPLIIRNSFVQNKVHNKPKSDKLVRSLIRHDAKKLAKVLCHLFTQENSMIE